MEKSFFGRAAELNEAKVILDRAIAGRGATLLLAGEPGIGKSRLADELATLAVAAGAAVHFGRGWEGGGAPVYWPWTEALTSLTSGLDATQLAALLGEDAPELVRLLPDLRGRLPHLEAASLPDADEGRFRLARAVADTLKRAAEIRPLVIVLDDLHIADTSTLSCMQYVARSARSTRLLLLGTYREAETRLSPVLAESVGVLARDATTLNLAAIDRASSLELIAARSHLDGAVAASIAAIAGGNPLFLTEMSRLVAARGAAMGTALELPLGVKESIRQRLALLPATALPVLEMAACAGREFDASLVASALGSEVPDAVGPLELAMQAGMVVEREGGRRAFSHDLLREVLYRGLPRERRLRAHQKLAVALRSASSLVASNASAIAHHLLEAAELDADAAIRAALAAAQAALDVVAYEEALTLLDRAHTVAREPKVSVRLVAELWLITGEARIRAGQVQTAKDACKQAAAIARQLEDVELFARAALTWGSEIQPGTIDAELVEWLKEADRRLPNDLLGLRARVKGRLAAALQPSMKPREPVAMAHEAIALARELGDDRTLLEVLHSSMAAMMEYEHPQVRLPLNLEQEALARRFHDRPRELRARLRLFFDYLVSGDVALAESRALSFDALARELKQTRFAGFLPSWRAARATYEGKFEEASNQLDEARRVSPPNEMTVVRDIIQRAIWVRTREDVAAIATLSAPVAAGSYQMAMGDYVSQVLEASTHGRFGDVEKARAILNRLVSQQVSAASGMADGIDALLRYDPLILTLLSEAIAAVEDRRLAKVGYQLLLPVAGIQVHHGLIGMAWEGPVHRVLGILAFTLGDFDAAITHFEAAIADLKALGGRGFLARALFECAEARLKRAQADDAYAAAACVHEAKALAQALGQTHLIEQFRTRAPAAEKPGVAKGSVPLTKPATLTASSAVSLRKEGDYWLIEGEGAAFRLKDSRGLQLLSRLLERPNQEVHCLELASDGSKQDLDAGDAGEWLDADARRQYQARVEDLRESLTEAEKFADTQRAAKARAELDFIAGELARGVGLGGRLRKAGSTAERARVAVQRRIKDAVARIGEQDPNLGRHLEWAVKTGTYCCYRPSR